MNRQRDTYMSATRRRHLSRLASERRILSRDQAERARQMRERGLSWPAIAAWFTRNGTPVSWQTVRQAAR